MKNIKYILLLAVAALFTASCEQDIKTWSGLSRINFVTAVESDTIIYHSFVFLPEQIQTDTVWVEVITQGFVTDYARPVRLKAEKHYEGVQAIAGTHYIDFDYRGMDEKLKALYMIPAGKESALLPVVLLRDPSLRSQEVFLRVVFDLDDNEYFQYGFSGVWSHRTIIFSDMLARPQMWNEDVERFFGVYGPVKHRFMIETAGQEFNDDWILDNFVLKVYGEGGWQIEWWEAKDEDYMYYLARWLQRKLDEENESRRVANGGVPDPLTEENNVPVEIFRD